MMKKRTVKTAGRISCVALAIVMAVSSGGTAFASAASTQKDETVYSTLDSNGKVKSTTVSDWLHSDDAAAKLLDKSDLSNIKNVKSNETPTKDGDNLIWQLNSSSTDKTGSNIYYDGTTNKELPLTVSVAYYLNGKEIAPAKLAGKSGKVEIKVDIKNNEKHTVNVNGKETVMYTPMTAIVMTALPSDTFKNVTLSDGKLFSDGKNQFVAFVTMPGLNDSLQLTSYSDIPELSDLDFPEELDIKANVTNFSLDTIAVAATPELIDSDKLKNSTDIDEMRTNLNKLKKIQDDIDNVDSDKSIRSLFTNSDRTAAARLLIDDVFDFYKLDLKMTDLASDYVTNDNIKLYDRVTSDLDKADIKYLLDNKVLRGINGRLTDENINKGRTLLKDYDEIETFDMVKLNNVLKALNHYDKLYDKFDGFFDDAKRVENHLNTSSLDTITKLSNSSIENHLSDTMDSLDELSDSTLGKLVTSGAVNLDDSDIQALVEHYLERDNYSNLFVLLGQDLKKEAGGDNITLKGLMSSSLIKDMGNDEVSQALQSYVINNLIGSFSPELTVTASDLKGLIGGAVQEGKITTEAASQLEKSLGIKSSTDKIPVSTLLSALSGSGLSAADVQSLESQMMSTVIKENSESSVPVESVVKAVKNAVAEISENAEEKTALEADINKAIDNVAQKYTSGSSTQLSDLLNDAENLQSDLQDKLGDNYEDKLESAFNNLRSEKGYIEDLQNDLNNITDDDDKDKDTIEDDLDQLEDVVKNKSQTDYLIGWGNKIKDMKNDLDDNSENISIMRDLLKQYDDPKIKNAKNMIPTLQKDLDDSRPILESLKDKLDEPAMNASLHKLPETTKTLLKMKDDIDNNHLVMNIFKKTMAPATVSVFKNTFDTLDDFKKDGTVDSYTKKLDDADDLIARKDAYVKLSSDYKIFTQSADGAKTKLKFVMKTAEIKAPDKTATTKAVSTTQDSGSKSSGGFFGWVKSVWSGTVKLFKNIF